MPFKPCITLTHLPRLADRDIFMRYRGGGVGHLYMRHIEPWLDATGWGTTWPSLEDRYPEDPEDNQENSARPSTSTQSRHQNNDGNGDSGEDNSGKETDPSDVEDDDGDDPEQPEDDSDEDSEDDTNSSGNAKRNGHSKDEESRNRGDESDDEAEGHHL